MANNAHKEGRPMPSTSRLAPDAIRGLTLLLLVGAVLLFSGCQNGGAAHMDTMKIPDGNASAFLIFPGTAIQSVDGGAHWTQFDSFLLPKATGHQLPTATGYEVAAISPTTRWEAVSTTDGTSSTVTVARTDNGGRTWHQMAFPTFAQPSARPVALQFLDATHGWLEVDVSQANSRRGLLFSTQDGGGTWTSTPLPFGGSIVFTSDSVGWLTGSQWATVTPNTLARTTDGGKTWTTQTLPLPEGAIVWLTTVGQPIFFDRQNGIVPVNVRQSTLIYATHNGGASWTKTAELAIAVDDFQEQPFDSASGRSAWIRVGGSLFVTHDAGATWATVHPDTDLRAAELLVRSDTTAYALTLEGMCASASGTLTSGCTNRSTILRTSDGGHTWDTVWTYEYQYP